MAVERLASYRRSQCNVSNDAQDDLSSDGDTGQALLLDYNGKTVVLYTSLPTYIGWILN